MIILGIVVYFLIGIGFALYVYTSLYGDAKFSFYLFGIIAWPLIFLMSLILVIAEGITNWFDSNHKNGGIV